MEVKIDGWTRVVRIVHRIGVETLWQKGDEWSVSLVNRTYRQWFHIPKDKVELWKKEFKL